MMLAGGFIGTDAEAFGGAATSFSAGEAFTEGIFGSVNLLALYHEHIQRTAPPRRRARDAARKEVDKDAAVATTDLDLDDESHAWLARLVLTVLENTATVMEMCAGIGGVRGRLGRAGAPELL